MSMSITGCLLGLLLGIRHALEPDHLAAVSTLATEQRSTRALLRLGAAWGIGHSVALLLVGGSLSVLEQRMPERLATALELGVAVMVMGLGARAVVRAVWLGRTGPVIRHRHGALEHAHASGAEHVHLRGWTLARRPLLVGLVHGLAGSGALTALVLAGLPTVELRLLYIGLFGLGSVVGMAALTGAAGVPLQRLAPGSRAGVALQLATGIVSLGVGGFWGATVAGQFFPVLP